MSSNIVSTPTHERCVTSYAARTQYKPGVVHPPHIKVKDAIDIHCHAHEGQQDPYDLARRASLAEMKGLLFKSIPGEDPVKATAIRAGRRQSLGGKRRCHADHLLVGLRLRPANGTDLGKDGQRNDRPRHHRGLAAGIHPRDHHEHGGNLRRFVQSRNAPGWTGPIPWDEAMQVGHYDLDENGKLKPEDPRHRASLRRPERRALFWPRHPQGNLQARRRSREDRTKTRRDRSSLQSVFKRLSGDDEGAPRSGDFFQLHLG